MKDKTCSGEHRYYVGESVAIPSEGVVWLLGLCLGCGDSFGKKFKVTDPNAAIVLGSLEKTKTKEI